MLTCTTYAYVETEVDIVITYCLHATRSDNAELCCCCYRRHLFGVVVCMY